MMKQPLITNFDTSQNHQQPVYSQELARKKRRSSGSVRTEASGIPLDQVGAKRRRYEEDDFIVTQDNSAKINDIFKPVQPVKGNTN